MSTPSIEEAKSCPSCDGQGAIGDYVGLEMRCVGVECDRCKGTGRLPPVVSAEVEHRELCGAIGGNLRPTAKCMFPKGHPERYHSSDGTRITNFSEHGYYWHTPTEAQANMEARKS